MSKVKGVGTSANASRELSEPAIKPAAPTTN